MAIKTVVSAAAPLDLSSSRLRIYPNPGYGRVHFELGMEKGPGRTTVEIFDLRGRRLRRMSAEGTTLVWDGRGRDGRRLAVGTYLAVVSRGSMRQTKRLMILH